MYKILIGVSIIIIVLGSLFILFHYFYEKYRNRDNDGKKSKLMMIKFRHYIFIFLILMFLSINVFLIMTDRNRGMDDAVSPVKHAETDIIQNKYDKCVAFGHGIKHYELLYINFLNRKDEDTLNKLQRNFDYELIYNVYLVQKDNVDYVKINPMKGSPHSYMFESNLPFSFDYLISKFEEASGTKMSSAFLNKYDTGIFIHIETLYTDNQASFISDIDGKRYYGYYDEDLIILK